MKKILYSLLTIALLMLNVSTVNAKEYEDNSEIIQKNLAIRACEVFPEYTDIIMNYTGSATTDLLSGEPVVCVTREIGENEVWLYQEYASGAAAVGFYKTWGLTNTSSQSGYTDYTGTFTVTCNMSNDIFQRCNFKYRIRTSGYDSILSSGTATGNTCSASLVGSQSTETSSSKAYYQYVAYFLPRDYLPLATCACTITFYVGNNTFSTSVI